MAEHLQPTPHRLVSDRPSRFGMMAARRRRGLRRTCLIVLAFVCSLVFFGMIGGGLLFMRLAQGPIDVGMGNQIAAALGKRVGGGYTFSVGTTAVEQSDNGPSLVVGQFAVKDRSGRVVMAAPRAGVSVDLAALAVGVVSPKRLDVQDILLRVVRREDGRVAMSAGADNATDFSLSDAFPGVANHDSAPGAAAGPKSSEGAAPTPGAPSAAAPASTAAATPAVDAGTNPATTAPAGSAGSPILIDALTKVVDGLVAVGFDAGSPFRGLDRFGIRRGTLVVEDRLRQTSLTYRDFTIDLDREENGSVFITAAAEGPSGRWSISARVSRTANGKSVDLAADHLTSDELMLLSGHRPATFETDMPISIHTILDVSPHEKLTRAEGQLSFGAGYFKLDDPDHEPAMVDGIDATLRLDPDTGELEFGAGTLRADQTTFKFGMRLVPPAKPDAPWGLTGEATGALGPERPGEQPIALDQIHLAISVFPELRRFVLDSFTAKGPNLTFRMNAAIQGNDTGFLVTSSIDIGRVPGTDLIRLWPNWVAAEPRAWFLQNLHGGTLDYGRGQFKLTKADLDRMRMQRSPPDDHVHMEFGVSNMSLSFMGGVPPLQGLSGTGVITGDTLNFTVAGGEMEVSPGHKLSLSDATFTIPDTDPKPSPAVVGVRVTGSIDVLSELLAKDALKPYANLPIDSADLQGQIDGRLTVNLKVGSHTPAEDTKIGVTATARNFAVANMIGKEPLEAGTLNIVADRMGLRANGTGRIFGGPATIDLKKPAGGAPSEAAITMVLDDAARAKAGFKLSSVTGPISARLTTSLTQGDKTKGNVELDFAKAAFESPLPGLKKAAGRPAKATFVVSQTADQVALDQIVFDSGGTTIRGSASLAPNGAFQSARFSQVRLSPGDDMKVDATQGADGLKLVVRGANIDARPFLKSLTTGDSEQGGDAATRDLDLDLHANLLTGQNAQAISAADVRLLRHGGQFRRIQMTGRLGHGAVSINTVGQGQGASIVISTKDAGATLSFLDLYKRMDGGRLDTTLKMMEGGRLDGYAVVHDFTIREDPSIKKLAEEEVPSGNRNSGARIDSAAVQFSKLEAYFSRVGNKVEVRKGAMFGPQVGATVEGSIDFARDRVALSGTFVPLYGLNNLFSQIPVVGLLLGGGAHEGLFALNYRIDGSASAPVVSFNPLSALAPGFLRKIFGAIDNAAQQGVAPPTSVFDGATGATPQTAPTPE